MEDPREEVKGLEGGGGGGPVSVLARRNPDGPVISIPKCVCGPGCSAKTFSQAWRLLHAAVIICGVACILHFCLFVYNADDVNQQLDESSVGPILEWPVWAGGALLVLAALPLLAFFWTWPDKERQEQLEERFREYGNVMLMSGALSGFLVSLLVLRRWSVDDGQPCVRCGGTL
jgi:hypothetical protein